MSAKIIHKRRSHTAKTVGNISASAVFYGLSAAGYATKTSTIGTVSAIAAGAAVGATGIGLLVGTGVLYLGYAAQAGRSAIKTNNHINNLKQIYVDRGYYSCMLKQGHDHTMIAEAILPYIIEKKRSKLHRKAMVAGTLGVGSTVETSRAVLKKAYKLFKGTAGKNRSYYAGILARHFKKCNCCLTDSIVGELYSEEEMNLMVDFDYAVVKELLEQKMKSV